MSKIYFLIMFEWIIIAQLIKKKQKIKNFF